MKCFPSVGIAQRFSTAIVVLWLATSAHAIPSPAQNSVALSAEGTGRVSLASRVELLCDETRGLTIKEVSSGSMSDAFTPCTDPVLNLGLSECAFWLRFTLSPSSEGLATRTNQATWLFDPGQSYFTSIRLYVPESAYSEASETEGQWRVFEAGDGAARTMTPAVRLPYPVFRLPVGCSKPVTIYVRVYSHAHMFLSPSVLTDRAFLVKVSGRNMWFGVYYGITVTMAALNLFLFVYTRNRNYLWYVLFAVTFAPYFAASSGHLTEYFTFYDFRRVYAVALMFFATSMICAAHFTRCFLNTKETTPFGEKLLRTMSWITGAGIALTPFLWTHFHILLKMYHVLGLAMAMSNLVTGIGSTRNGFKPARFYLLAWSFMVLGGVVLVATRHALLPPFAWGYHALQIGAALELILLSLALAYRVRSLQHDAEAAQQNERRYMELAITDGLTRLYNPRYFRSQLDSELARAVEFGLPLSLILLDADKFKQFNDTYGHPAGDTVLAALGDTLRACVRPNDTPCRYGGEEFAVIVPGVRGELAAMVAERIRKQFRERPFTPQPGQEVHVTVSIGVAEYVLGHTAEELIERADKALYDAKAAGRDCVMLAPSAEETAEADASPSGG